jgi:hypothetical protein
VKVRFILKNVDGSAFYFFFIAKNNEKLRISVFLKFNEEDSLRYLYILAVVVVCFHYFPQKTQNMTPKTKIEPIFWQLEMISNHNAVMILQIA